MANDDKFTDGYHTLIKDEEKTYTYKLYISDFEDKSNELHYILDELYNASENSKLKFYINSRGGDTDQLQQFYNIINSQFYRNTTTILNSIGYSSGALLFCMGDKRIVYEMSELMFHDFSTGARGKSQEIESRFNFTKQQLHNFFRKITVDTGFLTEEEFEKTIDGKDYWFDSDEMLKRGIATHIIKDGKCMTREEYLKE